MGIDSLCDVLSVPYQFDMHFLTYDCLDLPV
jgi:hypothetical protein